MIIGAYIVASIRILGTYVGYRYNLFYDAGTIFDSCRRDRKHNDRNWNVL